MSLDPSVEFTLVGKVMERWDPEDVERVCLQALGEEWRSLKHQHIQMGELLIKRQLQIDEAELTLNEVLKELEASQKRGKSLSDELNDVRTSTSGLNKVIDQNHREIHLLKDRINELQNAALPRQIPPELEPLSDLLLSIRPDRRCTASGCFGKRGWSGFTASIDKDGKRKITMNLCCGTVGDTDFTRLKSLIERHMESYELDIATRHDIEMKILHRTFFGGIAHAWNRLTRNSGLSDED